MELRPSWLDAGDGVEVRRLRPAHVSRCAVVLAGDGEVLVAAGER